MELRLNAKPRPQRPSRSCGCPQCPQCLLPPCCSRDPCMSSERFLRPSAPSGPALAAPPQQCARVCLSVCLQSRVWGAWPPARPQPSQRVRWPCGAGWGTQDDTCAALSAVLLSALPCLVPRSRARHVCPRLCPCSAPVSGCIPIPAGAGTQP